MSRAGFLLLLALAAGLWLLQQLSGAYSLMAGSPLGHMLDVATTATIAAALAVAVGWLILDVVLAVLFRAHPSGVIRVAVYGVLGLAALGWVFAIFGVDV